MNLFGTSAFPEHPIGVTTLSRKPSISSSVSVKLPFSSSIFLISSGNYNPLFIDNYSYLHISISVLPIMHVTEKEVREKVEALGEIIEQYKLMQKEEIKGKRDWRTYEEKLARRVRDAMRQLEPLIVEAVETLHVERGRGRIPSLTLKQKVTLLLIKQLFGQSNRSMSSMLSVFSLLTGIDVSYKTIERLYSDPEVYLVLCNLHQLILRKKGVKESDASGDGTGYSLTVSKHYRGVVEKRGDKAKGGDEEEDMAKGGDEEENKAENNKEKKKAFVYTFCLMDLDTKMYLCYGTSLKSEKEAFCRAMGMLKGIDVCINSVRLDKYYSHPSISETFGDARVYIIQKKDATLKGSWKWKRELFGFVSDPFGHLKEYFRRNNSESGFSADKRRFGWIVRQRRADRIDTASFSIDIWHNLFLLAT